MLLSKAIVIPGWDTAFQEAGRAHGWLPPVYAAVNLLRVVIMALPDVYALPLLRRYGISDFDAEHVMVERCQGHKL
jgi:hypothetical protein